MRACFLAAAAGALSMLRFTPEVLAAATGGVTVPGFLARVGFAGAGLEVVKGDETAGAFAPTGARWLTGDGDTERVSADTAAFCGPAGAGFGAMAGLGARWSTTSCDGEELWVPDVNRKGALGGADWALVVCWAVDRKLVAGDKRDCCCCFEGGGGCCRAELPAVENFRGAIDPDGDGEVLPVAGKEAGTDEAESGGGMCDCDGSFPPPEFAGKLVKCSGPPAPLLRGVELSNCVATLSMAGMSCAEGDTRC